MFGLVCSESFLLRENAGSKKEMNGVWLGSRLDPTTPCIWHSFRSQWTQWIDYIQLNQFWKIKSDRIYDYSDDFEGCLDLSSSTAPIQRSWRDMSYHELSWNLSVSSQVGNHDTLWQILCLQRGMRLNLWIHLTYSRRTRDLLQVPNLCVLLAQRA